MRSGHGKAAAVVGGAAACLLVAGTASAQVVALQPVATGLARPLFLTQVENDPGRLFIVEQRSGTTGRVRVVRNGTLQATPFVSITSVNTGSEQGLLGLAFHPNFLSNGWLYVSYTNAASGSVIERIRVSNPAIDNPTIAERQVLLTRARTAGNHNGGWIGIGPDGFLYIAFGDSGGSNDPGNSGQTLTDLRGKMLRIDVDGADNIPGNDDDDGVAGSSSAPQYTNPASNPFFGPTAGLDEIWAWGLRNPWRNSFDKLTGDLWIADVGQDLREEVNFQAAGAAGGQNYGWRVKEGTNVTGLGGGVGPFIEPVLEYDHLSNIPPVNLTGCSITGGFVYRGCAMPWLVGKYIFGDFCGGWIGAFDPATGQVQILAPVVGSLGSFGQDAQGELYVMSTSSGGAVQRLVPQALVDCNSNARADSCDIALGSSLDVNNNQVPDECDGCIADIDGQPGLDLGDFFFFLNCFDTNDVCADIDNVNGVDLADFFLFLNLFDAQCP